MPIFEIIRVLAILIQGYIFIISMRILLSWFQSSMVDNRFRNILYSITEPYLAIFRNIPFLKSNNFDYSPFLAIGSLIFFQDILATLAFHQMISFGIVLSIFIEVLIKVISMILGFLTLLSVIRLVGILTRFHQDHHVWTVLDLMINPILIIVMKIIPVKLRYEQLIIASILFLLLCIALINLLGRLLGMLLGMIPF